MNSFRLSEEQIEYQNLAREFAQREMSKAAHECDNKGEFPRTVLDKAWQQGLMNVQLPEQLGGLGLNIIEACVIAEELSFGCSGIYGAIESSSIALMFVLDHVNQELQQKLLAPLQDQMKVAGFALNLISTGDSQACRSAVKQAEPSLSLEKNGDDYLLNGKAVLSNVVQAEWLVLAAQSADGGCHLVVVEKGAALPSGSRVNLLGRRAMDIEELQFKSFAVPASHVVAIKDQADWQRTVSKAHCLFAAGAIGLARCGLEHAIHYSKERRTFGQPIGNHQAVGFMLADMAKDIQAARLLLLHAAELIAGGDVDLVSSVVAHSFAQEMAARVAIDAVQVYGGYGYSREYPVEKLMRDAKVYQLFLGSAHSAKQNVGKELLASV